MAKKKKKQQSNGQQFLSEENYLRQKARTLQIGTCYVTTSIDHTKIGHVIVTRRHTGGRISMAVYLVDMACVGVKDSFYRLRMDDYEFDEFLDDHRDMFRECSYEEAHNRIWGAVAYAEEAGIAPDKSFKLTQYMLQKDTDDTPLIEYEYGRNGKHFLTCRSELEASRYLPLMRQHLGEGKYQYIVGIGDPGFDDDDYDGDYDNDYDDDTTTCYNLPIEHLDMADIVNAKSVNGPKFISMHMHLDIHNIEDEAEFRSNYVDYILKHPKELLSQLPKIEIDILLYLYANREKAKGIPVANTKATLFLEIAGVADCYWNNRDEYCIRVADDFQRVALPLVTSVRMSDEARRRYEVENVIEGMANLYGEVTQEDAKRGVMMARGGFRSEAGRLIDKVMDQSLLLAFMFNMVDGNKKGLEAMAVDNLTFSSCYAWENIAELRKTIAAKQPGQKPKQPAMPTQPFTDDEARRFTTDEYIEASCGGSREVPTFPNKRQKDFWNFLTRELKWSDYYANRICLELWYMVNHEEDPDNDDDETIEQYFKDEALSLDGITETEREKGMKLLADYVANIPRWTLKGYAPAEL